jgi:hypothetical protein
MVKKKEALAEREEMRHKEKEVATKSFGDLQMRDIEVEEANAKSRLLEAEAKARLIDANAKSRLLEAEAKVIAQEDRIMLTDLDTISSTSSTGLGLIRSEILSELVMFVGQWRR